MRSVFLSVLLALSSTGYAAELEVVSAWARASAPGAKSGAIYVTLRNPGNSDIVITRARSDHARSTMIHETVMEGGMMRMKHRDELVVPAGGEVTMAPGGLHIMMMGLNAPLVEGERATATLMTDDNDAVTVDAVVGSIGQMDAPQ